MKVVFDAGILIKLLDPRTSDDQRSKLDYLIARLQKTKTKILIPTPAWSEFYVKADPGEETDIAAKHPEVIAELETAYDRWWEPVLPLMVNEDAVGPQVNPFKEQYWNQFGGGPRGVEPEGSGR